MALDAKVRLKEAKAQRFKQYDSKRKAMVEELEERERAFKKAKMEQQKEDAEERKVVWDAETGLGDVDAEGEADDQGER